MIKNATIHFFGSLKDFKINEQVNYSFTGTPSVKDAIEANGVPHTEVNRIYVNDKPVDFSFNIEGNEDVKVYPTGYACETVENEYSLPEKFIIDVHLGKLARELRLLGFDSKYENFFTDEEIAKIAHEEERIVLTRDIELLKNNLINWGYWIRSQDSDEQVKEVLKRYNLLDNLRPFTRCRRCNGIIKEESKEDVLRLLPPNTKTYFNDFFQCQKCQQVYWKGSHYEKMVNRINELRKNK